jgi:hypothetical protein
MQGMEKRIVDHGLWFLLLFFYTLILLVAFVRIFRIWLYRHRFCSCQGAFLLLCCFWSSMRLFFWSSTPAFLNSLGDFFHLFLYWGPDILQFAMISLITLYSFKIIKIRVWAEVRVRAYTLYYLSNIGVAMGLTTWLIIQRIARNNQKPIANSGLYFAIFSGGIYGIMMFLLVYYGYRVYRIRLRARSRSLRHPFSTSTAMAGLTVAVFLVFVVKPISAFQSDATDLPYTSPDTIMLSNFFLVFLCEILPTATILMVFRAVPSSRVTRCRKYGFCCCGSSNQSTEELEESLIRQGEASSSNSNEYWDRRRKNQVLGSDAMRNPVGNEGGGEQQQQQQQHNEIGEQQRLLRHPHDDPHPSSLLEENIMYGVSDGEEDNGTRGLYDSDSESSPFARARVSGSTPGTPLFLPPSGEASFVPPIPGSSPIRGGIGPRDLLASVSSSFGSSERSRGYG